MLPNFICPGAQKAGTTTLFKILKQHPSVYLPAGKEPRFFFEESKFEKRVSWYEERFYSDVEGQKAIGDMTPEYMYFEEVPQRIHEVLGSDVKFIFLLRNPVERAYSHYWMSYRRGYENASFEKAIGLEEYRIKRGEWERNHFSYVSRGFYSVQIERFLDYFPEDNMKFVLFEEFVEQIPNTVCRILDFLNVEPYDEIDYGIQSNPARMPRSRTLHSFVCNPPGWTRKLAKVIMPSRGMRKVVSHALTTIRRVNYNPFEKPDMNSGIREKLRVIFEDDIIRLADMIDQDLSLWLEPADAISEE